MPDKPHTPPLIQLADYGPDDPTYQRLREMICTTLVDVHLVEAGGTAAASVMHIAETDRHAIVLVLFDRSFTDPAFTDAIMALLNHRAPLVGWYVVGEQPEAEDDDPVDPDMGVTVIGVYAADMPAEAITVVT